MTKQQDFKFCFCFKRMFKLIIAEPPEDVRALFKHYSDNGPVMTIDQLCKFLIEYQHEEGDEEAIRDRAQVIFNSVKHLNFFQRRGLHLLSFFKFLIGDLNAPLLPRGVHQNMNFPLAHYFLHTGHNSYLTGNQVSSDSSVEPIIRALKSGVRVIELDLWPNRNKTGVKVCHGGTLTSSVNLANCLSAIRDYAFFTSVYPVIITFEDHLDAKLQDQVAKMVKRIFGDALFVPESPLKEFPSPESLKRKILISTKPPKEDLETEKHSDVIKRVQSHQDIEIEGDEDEEKDATEYRRLIAIHAGKVRSNSIKSMLNAHSDKVWRLSLNEQKVEDVLDDHGPEVIRFTQRNLLRIFPKGTRIDSSNYNPLPCWMHGAQMVAANMQGYDKYLWLMQGMFRANGGCGYVKKPDFLLKTGSAGDVFDPKARREVKTTLKVKVYMGDGWHLDFSRTHFDKFSPPDFFAKFHIFGVPADKSKKKTDPMEDQWVPVWNKEFEFPLTVPELALLRIEVREFDTDRRHAFAGQTCLPVPELRTGIRSVPLYDKRGNGYRHVKLLVRFQFS